MSAVESAARRPKSQSAKKALPPDPIDPGIAELRARKQLSLIAKRLNLSRQAPHGWRRVPSSRVLEVARIVGLSPSTLRPDLYPPGTMKLTKKKNGSKAANPCRK
jgi:hypothetical protein